LRKGGYILFDMPLQPRRLPMAQTKLTSTHVVCSLHYLHVRMNQ
jgi:hypothetical protein